MNWFSDSTGHVSRTIWKWKWTFLVPIATLILPATIYALRQPQTFKATAITQINEKQGGGTGVLPGTRDKTAYALVNQARDRLLTTENMKPVAPILAPGADPENLGVLQNVAKDIEFDRQGDNSFAVSVIHTDPVIAARAVRAATEALLSNEKKRFVEEALLKKNHAELQLERANTNHGKAARDLNTFREQNVEARGSVQNNLRSELANVRAERNNWSNRKATWQMELDKLNQELADGSKTRTTAGKRPESAGEIAAKVKLDKSIEKHNEAFSNLQGLLGSKTEGHPKVVAARNTVSSLERSVRANEATFDEERRKADREWQNRTAIDLGAKRALKAGRVLVLTQEIGKASTEIQRLKNSEEGIIARLELAPGVQDKMAPLVEAKNLAFKQVEEAQKVSSAEEARYVYLRDASPSAVTPFAIIQPAQPPVDPHGPRRVKWLVLAAALGLGIGYGLMLLRRRFEHNNITCVEDLAGMLPGALVVPVPRLEQGPMLNPVHVARDVVLGSWVLACLALSVMAVATHRGMFEGPDWLRAMIGV